MAYDGIATLVIDDRWQLELHAHHRVVDRLAPFVVRVSFNGWPAGIVGPDGGIVAGGEAANEDALIAALQKYLKPLREKAEGS